MAYYSHIICRVCLAYYIDHALTRYLSQGQWGAGGLLRGLLQLISSRSKDIHFQNYMEFVKAQSKLFRKTTGNSKKCQLNGRARTTTKYKSCFYISELSTDLELSESHRRKPFKPVLQPNTCLKRKPRSGNWIYYDITPTTQGVRVNTIEATMTSL